MYSPLVYTSSKEQHPFPVRSFLFSHSFLVLCHRASVIILCCDGSLRGQRVIFLLKILIKLSVLNFQASCSSRPCCSRSSGRRDWRDMPKADGRFYVPNGGAWTFPPKFWRGPPSSRSSSLLLPWFFTPLVLFSPFLALSQAHSLLLTNETLSPRSCPWVISSAFMLSSDWDGMPSPLWTTTALHSVAVDVRFTYAVIYCVP